MEPYASVPFGRITATAVVGGLLGGAAMLGTMRLFRRGAARHDLLAALGGLAAADPASARLAGAALHACASIAFAFLYSMIMWRLGVAGLPNALYWGAGAGSVQGAVASLILVWVISERHPLEEFQGAGIAEAMAHFAGHVAYGAVVGLIIGVAAL